MKKETVFLSAVLIGAFVAIACQSKPESSATSPSAVVAADGSGGVTSSIAIPTSSPIGPCPGVPGPNTGPCQGGPGSPGPGGPGAPPTSSPLGPNPGFPGTPTPTPTPGTSPTPGTTPTPSGTPLPPGTIRGELTNTDQTFDRYGEIFQPPSQGDGCSLAGGTFFYDTYPISHPGGLLRVETVGEGTLGDPFLHVYRGTFNPLNACQNIFASDDDQGGNLMARIEAIFPAGSYVVVVTSFREQAIGTYNLIIEP